MKKSEWSDEQLENLLKQMPKIKDHRNPQDIYQNISTKVKKHRRNRWVFSSVATAAALLLIFILFPNIIQNQKTDQLIKNSASSSKKIVNQDVAQKQEAEQAEDTENIATESDSNANDKIMMKDNQLETTAVYSESTVNKVALTYAIPDNNAQNIIPVTVLVNEDPSKKWLTQYVETMGKLQEKEWGLTDFYPLNAEITYGDTDNIVKVMLPENHKYGMGSAAEQIFTGSLMQNFQTQNISKILFYTGKKLGVDLGNLGTVEELVVKPSKSHGYFICYASNDSKPFLVPAVTSFQSIDEAIVAMKNAISEYNLMPSIPAKINIKINDEVNKDVLNISFEKNTVLSNTEEYIYMIESILLTAKDFNFKAVKFNNASLETIGPFNMKDAIEVPIAPNLRFLSSE